MATTHAGAKQSSFRRVGVVCLIIFFIITGWHVWKFCILVQLAAICWPYKYIPVKYQEMRLVFSPTVLLEHLQDRKRHIFQIYPIGVSTCISRTVWMFLTRRSTVDITSSQRCEFLTRIKIIGVLIPAYVLIPGSTRDEEKWSDHGLYGWSGSCVFALYLRSSQGYELLSSIALLSSEREMSNIFDLDSVTQNPKE